VTRRNLLGLGLAGSALAAVLCFTPILVVLLGAVGLSAAMGYLDFVLLPVLVVFLGVTAVGAWRVWRHD